MFLYLYRAGETSSQSQWTLGALLPCCVSLMLSLMVKVLPLHSPYPSIFLPFHPPTLPHPPQNLPTFLHHFLLWLYLLAAELCGLWACSQYLSTPALPAPGPRSTLFYIDCFHFAFLCLTFLGRVWWFCLAFLVSFWNKFFSVCSPSLPETPSNPPASDAQTHGLQIKTEMLRFFFFFFKFKGDCVGLLCSLSLWGLTTKLCQASAVTCGLNPVFCKHTLAICRVYYCNQNLQQRQSDINVTTCIMSIVLLCAHKP